MRTIVFVILLICWQIPSFAKEQAKENAYQRILRTGVLRCGYIIWPPFMDKDIQSGKFSGMNYDYTEAVAKSLDLKVEWTQEVQTGQQVEELRSGKIDAICTAEGPLFPSTTKYLAYTHPFAYFPFFLYARANDKRFDDNLRAADTASVKIAIVDGDISSQIAATYFPHAARHAMPQMASASQMYMDVVSGKADLFIDGPISVNNFLKSNPGSLKQVRLKSPLSVIPNTISVLRGEEGDDLVGMLNQAIENIRNSGQENLILATYLKDNPDAIYQVAKPYK